MKTKLINYRTYNQIAKQSRSSALDMSKVTPIDRRSDFGNPYKIDSKCTREQSIKAYRGYFEWRIKTDAWWRGEIEKLVGKTLGCWCTPLPCHGDIIIKYLEGLE